MLRLIINLFFLFLYNFSFSQTSELGRFTVNVKNGCLPLEIEIVSENLDTSISVVQYDFDYNQTNNLFNPSSSKSQATPILKRIDGAKKTFIRIPAKKYAASIFFCALFN